FFVIEQSGRATAIGCCLAAACSLPAAVEAAAEIEAAAIELDGGRETMKKMLFFSTLLLVLPAVVSAVRPVKGPRTRFSTTAAKGATAAKDLAKFFDDEW